MELAIKQEEIVAGLENRKFKLTKVGKFGDAYLHYKKGLTTYLATVDRVGLVNGTTLEDYLERIGL